MAGDGLPVNDDRASEALELLNGAQNLIVPFIRAADEGNATKTQLEQQASAKRNGLFSITQDYRPATLAGLLQSTLPENGRGSKGLLDAAQSLFKYSLNTWDPGFLDKLYASNDAPGLAADLILSALNTNTHVYSVSPALTLVEKQTARALAEMYGFCGENAGGVTLPGGAVTIYVSMLTARNHMFPQVKCDGISSVGAPLAVFTSSDSHYSASTAAEQLGIGNRHVHYVSITPDGRMDAAALRTAVDSALSSGARPFYVCATAGTTVRGSYDPLPAIAAVCKEYGLWMHVDGCWGGCAVFSPRTRHLLAGSELADSISVDPHKMLGVPLTTCLLLGADMRKFYHANRLTAGYLFHDQESAPSTNDASLHAVEADVDPVSRLPGWNDVFDMAHFTGQCGRRGDSLKLYLAWQYYGSDGFAQRIDNAFAAARQLAQAIDSDDRMVLLNGNPPPCCQVCFRYVGQSTRDGSNTDKDHEFNTRLTREVVTGLKRRGWMSDYSPGDDGEYLRVVCNRNTNDHVVKCLVEAIIASGDDALEIIRSA